MAAGFSSGPSSSPTLLRHPLSYLIRRPPTEDLENFWILEFILLQPIPDSLAHEIFLSLPFSSPELHSRLRKTILLRRLSSDISRCSISERSLHSIELIEELDRLCGTGSSNHMKAAYCAAAVECTASAYRRSVVDFRDAAERIWMARIYNLMLSEAAAGLVSESLVQWWKKIVHYLWGGDGSEELFKTDVENAMRLVKNYVDEAMKEMGPSFLEIAADLLETRTDLDVGEDKSGKDVTEVNGFVVLDENVKELEDYGIGKKGAGLACASIDFLEEGEVRDRLKGLVDNSSKDFEDNGEGSVGPDVASTNLDKDQPIFMDSGQEFMEVEVEDNRGIENVSGHDKTNHSECPSHKIDSSEVRRKEALKKSCFDLNMVVEDPLPEAQAVRKEALKKTCFDLNMVVADLLTESQAVRKEALNKTCFDLNMMVEDPLPGQAVEAAVLAGMSHDHALLSENVKQTSAGNAISPVPTSMDSRADSLEDGRFRVNGKPSDFMRLEGNHVGKECNDDAGPSKSLSIVACGTIFERNPTAYTSEWSDDSLDTFDKSPVTTDNLQSLNPMTRRVLISRPGKGKSVKRRAVKRWSSEEEDQLVEAVAKCGKGNWKSILNSYSKIFEERTEVDLKDKWRNVSRHLS